MANIIGAIFVFALIGAMVGGLTGGEGGPVYLGLIAGGAVGLILGRRDS